MRERDDEDEERWRRVLLRRRGDRDRLRSLVGFWARLEGVSVSLGVLMGALEGFLVCLEASSSEALCWGCCWREFWACCCCCC